MPNTHRDPLENPPGNAADTNESVSSDRNGPGSPQFGGPAMFTMPPRPLWKTFLAFFAPTLLLNILQSLSGTINNIYLGQVIGAKALEAVSVLFPVVFLCIAFGLGGGHVGANRAGTEDHKAVRDKWGKIAR